MNIQPVIISLTVVLVVGIVMVQVFSSQLSRGEKKLKAQEVEEHAAKVRMEAGHLCTEKCNDVLDNDCSERSMAQFCLSHAQWDINGNRQSDYNQELLGGIGLCEDRMYCSHLVDCGCRQRLTMDNCIGILCEYWADQGLDPAMLEGKLNSLIAPGACWDASQQNHWYTVLGAGSPLACP
jgi:hypothetical protein